MLITKNAPLDEGITNLKRGDFFIDGEIIYMQKVRRIVSIVTVNNTLYNIHLRENNTYSLFRIKRINRKIKKPGKLQIFLRNCAFFL